MDDIKRLYQSVEPNLTAIGWMGAVGYLGYFFVWEKVFSLTYESLALRVLCAAMYMVLIIRHFLPANISRILPVYYYVVVGFSLPFTFYYMVLMNSWIDLWAMSFIASIFLHILLVQSIRLVIIQLLVAIPLAYAATFWQLGYTPHELLHLAYLPIILFSYIYGLAFFSYHRSSYESKISAAQSSGASIAHEMRNPMSILQSSIDAVHSFLRAHRSLAHENEIRINSTDIDDMLKILDQSDKTLSSANDAIDYILSSVGKGRFSRDKFAIYSLNDVITNAVDSFAYTHQSQRNQVSIEVTEDLYFFGSDILLKYTLFNLIKNAFQCQNRKTVNISIRVFKQANKPCVLIKDDGSGIERNRVTRVFDEYNTFGKKDGVGLGLAFCRRVMTSFDGSIDCRSLKGQWTEFQLTFPDSKVLNQIERNNRTNAKEPVILYVGEKDEHFDALASWTDSIPFTLEGVSLHRATLLDLTRYDAVFVNSGNIQYQMTDWIDFTRCAERDQVLKCLISPDENQRNLAIGKKKESYVISYPEWQKRGQYVVSQLLEEQKHRRRNKKNILLVEDNVSVSSITEIILRQAGFSVHTIQDANQALHYLNNQSVDLIMLDMNIPGTTGVELIRTLRNTLAHYKDVVILGYTGESSTDIIQQAYSAGMDDMLVKPANKKQIIAMLDRWL